LVVVLDQERGRIGGVYGFYKSAIAITPLHSWGYISIWLSL